MCHISVLPLSAFLEQFDISIRPQISDCDLQIQSHNQQKNFSLQSISVKPSTQSEDTCEYSKDTYLRSRGQLGISHRAPIVTECEYNGQHAQVLPSHSIPSQSPGLETANHLDILLTKFLAPGQRNANHALSAPFEEILESPTLYGSILSISHTSQKQSSSDGSLCLRARSDYVHILAHLWRVRRGTGRDTASGDSDCGRSE